MTLSVAYMQDGGPGGGAVGVVSGAGRESIGDRGVLLQCVALLCRWPGMNCL